MLHKFMSETLFLKNIYHSFKIDRNRSDFSIIKKLFFIIIKQIWSFTNQKTIFCSSYKQIWYFFKSKDFILCNKNISKFFISKNHFFYKLQNRSCILKNQNQFFLPIKIDLKFFLTKEETSFINKFMWFNFYLTCSTYHS